MSTVSIHDVHAAAQRIKGHVHRTPVMTSAFFNNLLKATLYFKCEHLQKVGAFKARGACNAVFMLDDATASRGVATHSSGNHAQALAYAAGIRGIACTIVMPNNAPIMKRRAVLEYGATVVECNPSLHDRELTLAHVIQETGAHFVPPYNDARVIAGQGTAALEMLEDVPDLDIVMAPVGGGGLMSGTAIVCREMLPSAEIIGAEPAVANDAQLSLETGVLHGPLSALTVADGLRTALGDVTFAILQRTGVRIVTATEASIVQGQQLVMQRMKQVVEPSASVTIGALLDHPEIVRGRRVGIILCGGNVDVP